MDLNLPSELGQELERQGLFLAAAESLTCGNIQAMIGSVSGSSSYFAGGVTAYRIPDKARLLNVDAEHARATNAVSERVAVEMAKGVCELLQCDIGIGTTGYAELSLENEVAAPYAHYAIWGQGRDWGGKVLAADVVRGENLSRAEMQLLVAQTALTRTLECLRD